MPPKIAFTTTCRGRANHVAKTLPRNLYDLNGYRNAVFVILDYNSDDGLGDYIQAEHLDDMDSGRLIYYRTDEPSRFRMAHAKNMAHRCGMLEDADILVTLDADNLTGEGFAAYLSHRFRSEPDLSFLCPDFKTLPKPGHRFNPQNPVSLGRGFAGRLAIRANDFVKVGGYNEIYDTWRGEDIDLLARLNRLGLKRGFIDRIYLNAIAHSSELRFREYPDAKRFENDEIYGQTERATDTIVNYGNFGCGTITRNFEQATTVLPPIPTRIFGVGFQRTGTSSLHEALKVLGMDSAHWKSAQWARNIWWEMNRWGTSRTLEQNLAICDNPIPVLYRQLDKAYPGSKFILTIRDESDWIRSVERFWTYEGNPQRWTWDEDGFSHKIHAIIYGQVTFDAEVFLERYRRHNEEVLAYFRDRPDDLLELNISRGHGWKELCGFFGCDQIDGPFPHRNRS